MAGAGRGRRAPIAPMALAAAKRYPKSRLGPSFRSRSMWIVRLALRRPYTFTVMALLIVVLGVLCDAADGEGYLSVDRHPGRQRGLAVRRPHARRDGKAHRLPLSERAMTTTVNDIEHIESESLLGVGVIKVFFHPGTSIDAAVAQVTAFSQSVVRQMPPGTTPPLIIRYSATNVPDPPARRRQQDPLRAGPLRHGPQLHPRAAGDRAGRPDPAAERRQAAPDRGRPRPAGARRPTG